MTPLTLYKAQLRVKKGTLCSKRDFKSLMTMDPWYDRSLFGEWIRYHTQNTTSLLNAVIKALGGPERL